MKKLIAVALTISVLAVNGYGYAARGHRLVGAIADKRLTKNKPVRDKVRTLLDGLTLAQVATLPDQIKSWDACGSRSPDNSPVTDRKRINRELRAFLQANLCNNNPSHNEFHYTNIPVVGNEQYADGEVGRREFDIVHLISFCIRVLRGDVPETNDRGVTKAVAVILITHYVGDIHQPLHVGAQFFNADGNAFQPGTTNPGFADQGGNKLTLFTFMKGKRVTAGNLHGYWDFQTVENAFGATADTSVAQSLAAKTPSNWKLDGGAEMWSEQMANRMMPVAREAHNRLEFREIESEAGKRDITSGRAEEKKKTGGQFYAVWAAATVKDQIHRGGWRLAALLEEALR